MRPGPVVCTALVGALVLAGCGSRSSGGPGTEATHAASPITGASSSAAASPLAFARCMRANGVSNFPDPLPGGGFAFHPPAGFNPAAPAVVAAQSRCQRFMFHPPTGPSVGSSSQEQAQALAQLRKVAQCMRLHGVSNFPDPQTSPPANVNPRNYSTITNYKGAWLPFPVTINMQSPVWKQAASACGPLAQSFNHPHH